MVGRGGGKNVGNRNKDGVGHGGHQTTVARSRRLLNQVQNKGNPNIPRRYASSSNQLQNEQSHNFANHNEVESLNRIEHTQNNNVDMNLSGNQVVGNESEGFISPESRVKRKRKNNFFERLNMTLEGPAVMDPPTRRDEQETGENRSNRRRDDQVVANRGSAHSANNADATQNGEATSKLKKKKGERGKYKSHVIEMKIKGKRSKLKIYIPDEIDRAIGDNARHLVNECGRVVRTRAPLNVNNWKDAFGAVGDVMWKEIEEKFEIKEGSSYIKMQAFAIDTMQRLYRQWKSRLYSYYKSAKCGQTIEERLSNPPPDLSQEQWEHCVQRFDSAAFKAMSERNSKNRLSEKRSNHTTGNLSYAEYETILSTQEKNDQGKLEWADEGRSKEIYEQLKVAVATHGESMTQEEILLDVLKPRSGYARGKGTALKGYCKGRQQLEQQNLINEQQKKIEEQQKMIKELQENQERTTRQIEQQKEDMQRAIDAMKQELLQQLTHRGS